MKHTARRAAASLLFALLFASPAARADGPGLPNLTYDPTEVMTVIGHVGEENGAPRGHGTLSFHRGYLTVVFSRDSGEGDGGFAFFDIADPKMPVLVNAKDDAETEDIREAHGYGFWGDYVVLQANYGIQFWDWSDVMNPKLVSYLKLPGVEVSDYLAGAWWAFWQAPYVYVGGSQNGLYIVDAHDVKNPKLADRGDDRPNPISTANLGGFRVGPVFAAGNLLTVSGMDDPGYAVLDISDPVNPLLLTAKRMGMPKVYSALFNGGRIYGAGGDEVIHVHDISDPFQLVDLGKSDDMGGKGGYLSFQDGFLHAGASSNYAKVDVSAQSSFSVVATVTEGTDGDRDFGTVLGNLVAVSDDHGHGSFLVPHQATPDVTPPAINYLSPKNGATNVGLTARVGMTWTDQIDRRTLNTTTFIVRPAGGQALPGRYSYQTNFVNFAPEEPFLPNTTYEIVLPQGGVSDLAGNPLAEAFIATFSTGTSVDNPLCDLTTSGPAPLGDKVSFSANVAGMGSLTYSWDFGDGSPATAPAPATTAEHTFAAPGHYTVNVFVRDANGLVTTCSLQQTIHRPLSASKPTRSSTILLDEEEARIWVVNKDSGSVSALDKEPLARAFEVPVGERPSSIAKAKDGSIWVAIEGEAKVAVLDKLDGHVVRTVELARGSRPMGLVMTPDGSRAIASLQGTGQIVEIDTTSFSVTRTLDVGPSPRGLAVTGGGDKVLVTRFLSPDDHAEVHLVDAASFALDRTISLALDESPDTEASGSGLFNYLRSVAISPDGKTAWVPAKKDNVLRGEYNNGKPLTFENSVRSALTALDLDSSEETAGARIDFNDRGLPSVAELTPLGDYVIVAIEGTRTIEIVDAYDAHIAAGVEDLGDAPDGLALDSTGKTLYVFSFLSRTVHSIDVSGLFAGTGTQVAEIERASTIDKEPLDPQVYLGKKIFYDASDRRMSRDKYLSCAVCHLDGEHDGRTWDFTDRGEGLRNTTTLLGKRGAGHGPLHWTANFDEIQDFEHDIRNAFGGKGFLPDAVFHADGHDQTLGGKKTGLSEELDAIDAYLASLDKVPLSPFRNADGSFTESAVAGAAIFAQLGCQECHVGPDSTDSPKGVLHDVGTIGNGSGQRLGDELIGFDTPTLNGIWATAPYLHKGSAPTLEAVLDAAAESGALHGDIASLTTAERAQLVDYLLQLDGTEVEPVPVEPMGCSCRIQDLPPSSGGRSHTAFVGLAIAFVLRSARRRRAGNP